MNVLVLGGNGFIGSNVVDHLIADGHKVRVYDRSAEKYRAPLSGVDYIIANFDDPSMLSEALQGIDIVFHFISTTIPSSSNLNPEFDIRSNLIGTLHLLEQMRQKDISRIVYLSSGGAVYGNTQEVSILENHPLNPICSYGIVKVAIEKYLYMYQQLYGLKPIVLRPSNPFGPRQGHVGSQGLIGTFINKIIGKEKLEIWGDGNIIRDYIFIDDFAKLCIAVIKSNSVGIFNAGSGVGYSINDVVETLRTVFGDDIKVQYKKGRSYDVKRAVLNINKTKECFDWEPEVSLKAGVIEYLQWVKSYEA